MCSFFVNKEVTFFFKQNADPYCILIGHGNDPWGTGGQLPVAASTIIKYKSLLGTEH